MGFTAVPLRIISQEAKPISHVKKNRFSFCNCRKMKFIVKGIGLQEVARSTEHKNNDRPVQKGNFTGGLKFYKE